jgi:iron(II)-dependent oxidoreductase
MNPSTLLENLRDARERTLALFRDLDEGQLLGPRLAIVNPPLWELGHVGWFQEHWVLRHAASRAPLRPDGDALYDSAHVPHDLRWDLPLPTREGTLAYLARVHDEVLNVVRQAGDDPAVRYFAQLALFHEDMHGEAFAYTHQTLAYDSTGGSAPAVEGGGPLAGDARIPGGHFLLGAARDEPFVFDNEKWVHPIDVRPFAIARAPVTQGQFADFVDDGGYERPSLWSDAGWRWRSVEGALHPVYWRHDRDGWYRRHFERFVPLEPHRPVLHVCAYEAEAYCAWARRRLPTEVEWEVAASGEAGPDGQLAARKRRFPWGDDAPTSAHANLDGRRDGCVDVGALAAGDSAFGCRQMIGNVWEWTATAFAPYPGFEIDPYREYSAPWFGTHRVLRGGCWQTRARLLRNTWRNFYTPDRRDVWAGFRTCALDD